MQNEKLKRAVTVGQLLNKKFVEMPFDNQWKDSFGVPEMSGVWIVWGNSGNGKTNLVLQLSKKLSEYGKVAYDTLEEGARKSFQGAVKRSNMKEVANKFIILNREHISDLKIRLRKQKSPKIVIIDSLQYSGLTRPEYIELKEEFDKHLFIFISHAEGKNPKGSLANFVRYDADVKIRVEGYKAFPVSRYGGGKPYVIWQSGADKYWGDNI